MSDSLPGKVYLIGAGPGDAGLITVRGAERIALADVVLYDGLANQALLNYAQANAEKICVGKHGHGGSWSQREIDDCVVHHSQLGETVARLKGGDTAVFARTAEEVERLIEEGIPFEIVPGITTALAIGPYAGIPLTHRDWSSAVALVTGQMQAIDGTQEIEDTLDWNALARFPGTLVLYMGVSKAANWSSKLIEAGKPPSTPVALIRRCSWPDQQTIRCDLATVSSTLASMPNFKPPVISVVGEVIRMSKGGDWFSQRPWFGRKVWITSPLKTAQILDEKFADQGAQTLVAPVMAIEPPTDWTSLDHQILTIGEFDWIVFSSVYGVDAFFHRLKTLGKDARLFANAKIAAVGESTANAIAKFSVVCDAFPQVQGAEGLAHMLSPMSRNRRFLFIRNPNGETLAMDRLREQGASIQSLDVYHQALIESLPPSVEAALANSEPLSVTATSKNIARQSMKLLGRLSNQVTWLSFSPSITELLQSNGCDRILTAAKPSFDSLVSLSIS